MFPIYPLLRISLSMRLTHEFQLKVFAASVARNADALIIMRHYSPKSQICLMVSHHPPDKHVG
ncbi:MAG: hypothetical protein ACOYUZ_01440 [Patescibacteria group bacterium]